jgi:HEAT repeat protein
VRVRNATVIALVNYYVERDVNFITAWRKGIQWLNPFLDTYEATIVDPYTHINSRIIRALTEVAMRDRVLEVRIAAIRALGVLRATDAIPSLGQTIYSDSYVRVEVLRTFIKLGDRLAAEYAIPFLRDDDPDVRHESLTAVGMLRSVAAAPELIKVFNSPREAKDKRLALVALALIGDPAAKDIMVSNLTSGETVERRFASEGIGRIGDATLVERVSRDRLGERNRDVKLAQAFALYQLGRREYVEEIVQDLGTRRRQQAIDYLQEARAEDLYPYLKQSSLQGRRWIVEALGLLGSGEAINELKPLLSSGDADLVNVTTLAIDRIERREGSAGAKRK